MRPRTATSPLLTVATAALAAIIAGCVSSAAEPSQPARPATGDQAATTTPATSTALGDDFWSQLEVNAIEQPYGSLAELVHASDAVVLGRITAVRPGRVVDDGGQPRELVYFAAVIVEVERVIAGTFSGDQMTIDFLISRPEDVTTLAAKLPPEPTVFFVKDLSAMPSASGAPGELESNLVGHYFLTIQSAVLRDDGGVVRLRPHVFNDFIAPLAGRPFNEVVAEIGELGASR